MRKDTKMKFNFKPFDKVIVRNENFNRWFPTFYARYEHGYHLCVDGKTYKQCLPYTGKFQAFVNTTKCVEVEDKEIHTYEEVIVKKPVNKTGCLALMLKVPLEQDDYIDAFNTIYRLCRSRNFKINTDSEELYYQIYDEMNYNKDFKTQCLVLYHDIYLQEIKCGDFTYFTYNDNV